MDEVREKLEHFFRHDRGRVIAALIRHFNDFDIAEESLQEAGIMALRQWPETGIPTNIGAWLFVVAKRRSIDVRRRDEAREAKYAAISRDMPNVAPPPGVASTPDGDESDEFIPDERLRLIFTCCHPALNRDARIALTLRTLGGLTTKEIARAFLLEEATLTQRLTRAKRKIREAGIAYEVPDEAGIPERLEAVLTVIYLIFNEGYLSNFSASLIRAGLCEDAIRLADTVHELLPREVETAGLLALLHLQHSRRDARLSPEGDVVTLEEQDRTRWKRDEIEQGLRILRDAMRKQKLGPYQIQAAIAAVHARAKTAHETDWAHIASLYRMLNDITPSPVIELNRAVAVSMAHGPEKALALLDSEHIAEPLQQYRWYYSTRGEFLRKLGRYQEAGENFARALSLTENEAERMFLRKKVQETEMNGEKTEPNPGN